MGYAGCPVVGLLFEQRLRSVAGLWRAALLGGVPLSGTKAEVKVVTRRSGLQGIRIQSAVTDGQLAAFIVNGKKGLSFLQWCVCDFKTQDMLLDPTSTSLLNCGLKTGAVFERVPFEPHMPG